MFRDVVLSFRGPRPKAVASMRLGPGSKAAGVRSVSCTKANMNSWMRTKIADPKSA